MPSAACLACLFIAGVLASSAQADEYPRPNLLVEPAELARQAHQADLVILDARERSKYDAGHLPHARWVDHADWSKNFADGEQTAAWSQRLGHLGLQTNTPVVVYDDNLSKDAARIWWILRYWGLRDVRLLQGGWHGWQAAALPIENTPPADFSPTSPQLAPAADRLATQQALLEALKSSPIQIVDARSEGEYCGLDALTNRRAGAIPGATHLEWSDLLDPQTQRFKPAAQLRHLFETAGIDVLQPTVTHCQSGGRASVMAFALELMGGPQVSNFYRGWSQWGNSDDTPIEPGKPR